MEHATVTTLIADYVLDLLPAERRRLVENHAAGCVRCRLAIKSERQIGQEIRIALGSLPRPEAGVLSRRQPAPRRQPALLAGRVGQRQLAALALMLLLLVGSLGLNQTARQGAWSGAPPPWTTQAATMTHTPTSTAVSLDDGNLSPTSPSARVTAALDAATQPVVMATPLASAPIWSH